MLITQSGRGTSFLSLMLLTERVKSRAPSSCGFVIDLIDNENVMIGVGVTVLYISSSSSEAEKTKQCNKGG
jgi:hypothetical protein